MASQFYLNDGIKCIQLSSKYFLKVFHVNLVQKSGKMCFQSFLQHLNSKKFKLLQYNAYHMNWREN